MKQLIFILLLIAISASSCNKCKIEKYIPDCIEEKTTAFCERHNCKTASVEQYLFMGETVFVFSPGNCSIDMSSEIFNSSCSMLGILGGISGNTKINGVEFSEATFVRNIWQQAE